MELQERAVREFNPMHTTKLERPFAPRHAEGMRKRAWLRAALLHALAAACGGEASPIDDAGRESDAGTSPAPPTEHELGL